MDTTDNAHLPSELEALVHRLKELITKDQIFNFSEVVSYLRLPAGTIRELIRFREIPCHKVGRRLLFRQSEVDRWLSRYRLRQRPHTGKSPTRTKADR
ncbi:MAG: hypothetical protein OJF52_001170 [Nitrospira sp.]|jgi:excisionase family DNA binding protein|nr:MAG: hypothetical protein OJF52_001170 [Nitrospira sp.]